MNPTSLLLTLALILFAGFARAQPYARWDGESLVLDNGVIRRVIRIDQPRGCIFSNSMRLSGDKQEFLAPGTEEFAFSLNGRRFSGADSWTFVSIAPVQAENSGYGAEVTLESPENKVRISITYLLYPDLPIIRKKITFTNLSGRDQCLESVDLENLRFDQSGTGTESWVMHDYARQKSLGQYIGNWYDPVVIVHEVVLRRGMILGNEAPGVMKRTTAFLKHDQVTTGLTHADQQFGFRKWLKPGIPWESTWVFTGIYAGSDDPYAALNGPVNDYVRKHLGTRLSKTAGKPVLVYDTWEPFLHNINDQLVRELADAAAECGIQEFIIDDGWRGYYGDWDIDKEKFPDGLKPVFDYIKAKGMKPGLWISLAAAESNSRVYREHPEWLVRKADGSPINLHADDDRMFGWESYSMCMTSGWYDHIKGVILNLVKEHGLEYIKGDFAAVTGAYTTDKSRSGCHATNHPLHADRNESLLALYDRTWQLFDDLHAEAPDLYIDCTFETMGALQLIDLDMCKHAEGNWLSNFSERAPGGSLRVRQMAWWRTPVIPAATMLIGNQKFEDPEFELSLKSLTGSLPVVLGDPRLLSADQRARMKAWADWMKEMQAEHDFMSFRQDLKGYGEPAEGNWDGFQRINSESHSGGIVGIFRQGSHETRRVVTVQFLDPAARYEVKNAPMGEVIHRATGDALEREGFGVELPKRYDGAVYEVSRVN
jgi:alpha-galactosidase